MLSLYLVFNQNNFANNKYLVIAKNKESAIEKVQGDPDKWVSSTEFVASKLNLDTFSAPYILASPTNINIKLEQLLKE